jgi:hypothetical protein
MENPISLSLSISIYIYMYTPFVFHPPLFFVRNVFHIFYIAFTLIYFLWFLERTKMLPADTETASKNTVDETYAALLTQRYTDASRQVFDPAFVQADIRDRISLVSLVKKVHAAILIQTAVYPRYIHQHTEATTNEEDNTTQNALVNAFLEVAEYVEIQQEKAKQRWQKNRRNTLQNEPLLKKILDRQTIKLLELNIMVYNALETRNTHGRRPAHISQTLNQRPNVVSYINQVCFEFSNQINTTTESLAHETSHVKIKQIVTSRAVLKHKLKTLKNFLVQLTKGFLSTHRKYISSTHAHRDPQESTYMTQTSTAFTRPQWLSRVASDLARTITIKQNDYKNTQVSHLHTRADKEWYLIHAESSLCAILLPLRFPRVLS